MKHTKPAHVTLTLLVLMVMLIITTTAAVAVGITSMRDTLRRQNGESALLIAQSGVENAILRLLRDPSGYTGDVNLPIATGHATITLSGSSPITIVSVGTSGTYSRTITAVVTISSGQLVINSWTEQ